MPFKTSYTNPEPNTVGVNNDDKDTDADKNETETENTETESDTVTDGSGEMSFEFKDEDTTNSFEYDLSDNVVKDIVDYSRGNIIKNEEQAVMTLHGWLSGWMANEKHYINTVTIGQPSSGKTHKDKRMKKLLPPSDRFETTDATDSALVDDPEWDTAMVAIMSEVQKLSDKIIEFMKASSGDDGGFTKKRSLAGTEDGNNHGPAGTNTIEKQSLPFSFTYAQFDIDDELNTRLFKIFIDESKEVIEATTKLQADFTDIELPNNLSDKYIYDTTNVRRALRDHIRGLPRNANVYIPNWVHTVVSPILDMDRPVTNRISAQIFNFIRVSCLLNYKNRETIEHTFNNEPVKAFVVHPQDVANIIACRKTLVGTTHDLEPRKLKIVKAVEYKTKLGEDAICTIEDIQEYLESDESDLSRLSKTTLQKLLKELADNFIIKIHERYEGSSNGYEFRSLQKLGHPKLTGIAAENYPEDDPYLGIPDDVDPDQPLEKCIDPIKDQPISETVAQFQKKMSRDVLDGQDLSAADVMGSDPYGENSDTGTSDTTEAYKPTPKKAAQGQMSLGDNTPEITDAVTATVYDAVKENVRGKTFEIETLSHEHVIGVCEEGESLSTTDEKGTLADPQHAVWHQPDRSDNWVTSVSDANGELEIAYSELQDLDVIQYETHDDDATIPDGELRVIVNEAKINV